MITVASTRWRPTLSPSGPKTSPPKGRTKKAAAKTANVLSSAAVGLPGGKKTTASVVARKL
jgi:hypothetical protein